ncbi:MAG: sensor histidine kinase [Patescibacteria group bacterium]
MAKKIKKANRRLREFDKAKTEFLSLATHQIRSPLTSIRGYVSMMLEGDYGEVNEGLKEPLNVVDHSTKSLIKIVNDFLNVSRIEQGRMSYEFQKKDMRHIVKNIVEEYRPSAEEKGLEMNFESIDEECNAKVDENKIEQVIGNLIDNAIKYTPEGKIGVRFSKPNKGRMHIKISDTGVGIDPKEISSLFAKFKRAKGADKVNTNGSGLGIYLAKKIAEDHGGTVKVESEGEGKGSVFTIELPMTS